MSALCDALYDKLLIGRERRLSILATGPSVSARSRVDGERMVEEHGSRGQTARVATEG